MKRSLLKTPQWMLPFLLSLCSFQALAQPAQHPYPNKPIKLIVAFAPGGPADIIARLMGQKLSESMGQAVVIENKAGAGGNIASLFVTKSAPDGYTVLVNTSSLAVNASLLKNPGFDAEKDLLVAGVVASSPNLLVSSPSLKAKNLQEVVAEAKEGSTTLAPLGLAPRRI